MTYLDLKMIKKQCVIDDDFHIDDEYLNHLGTVAEAVIAGEIDCSLSDIADKNGGQLPTPLLHAGYMIVDYLYGAERGSSGNDIQMPETILRFCRLFREYN